MPEERERLRIAGNDYQRTQVQGELTMVNRRAQAVRVVVRRRFSGELLRADGEPDCELLEEGVYSINQRNELTWTLILEPGETRKLTYEYSVLVDI